MDGDVEKDISREEFGPNIWLVDEMYRRYQESPGEVSESWREFFEDYKPSHERRTRKAEPEADSKAKGDAGDDGSDRKSVALKEGKPKAEKPKEAEEAKPESKPESKRESKEGKPQSAAEAKKAEKAESKEGERVHLSGTEQKEPERRPADQEASQEAREVKEEPVPLRGVAARIAENMEASLGVPTATSVRTMPAKLLEENRRVINRYLSSMGGGKVSYTHIIGWAVLKALQAHPDMTSSYQEVDGKPHIVHNKHVNFGLAVDIERSGSRVLLVPNIKAADQLDFAGFFGAYEDLIRRVRSNELKLEDFEGTTVTLTNPGTVGTSQSVPRLMEGQGLIVGTGAIAYPTEYEAADPKTLARLGVSKLITITSTYDHRVIQGAESGEFLSHVHDLLLGVERFYDEIFLSLKIPYEPARWSRDRAPADDTDDYLQKQSRVIQLINMYRVRGHLLAELNPIGWEILSHSELDLSHYGLTVWDLDRDFVTDGLPGPRKQPLRQILDTLRDAYCRTVGVEYMHISDPIEKRWIQGRIEPGPADLSTDERKHILDRLNAAESFERFLHTKFVGHRRYSLEGADSLIPMMDALLEQASGDGMVETVIGMAHRGRLNMLANIVGKPLPEMFKEFAGDIDPDTVQGSGDVKYHLGMTGRYKSRFDDEMAVVLASNASHLESVDPVVEGMARAKQDLMGEDGEDRVLPVLIHGDAAFAGQGVVAETFNMSQLAGYRTGGTVHIVVNNNIGFTTSPAEARSSTYATDIAKMIQAPILHVNGDDPESCVRVARLAYEYRREFKKDVVIDLVCYRRHGHQEVDDPSFTQPVMYQRIEERRSVRKLYTEDLVNRGELTVEEAEEILNDFQERLQKAFDETRGSERATIQVVPYPKKLSDVPPPDTSVEQERLKQIHELLTSFPDGFSPHPKLKRMIDKRRGLLENNAIDWSHAEALAFGSLLLEGFAVRLSGQDSRRGTFSQRHSVLVDYETEEEYVPLANLSQGQAPFMAYDSLLSELAALGFEYGYSIANGDALVCWEAQFGDFVNGGQVVIDQYLVAGEDKWAQLSGLVLLLPHGFEGQGPEHSSARLERFLTLSAEDSIQVTQPSTPAQYFHLLRRQLHRSIRKPIVVLTPKSLLRHPDVKSATAALAGGAFKEVLDDPLVDDPDGVERILLCTGKIAYSLRDHRQETEAPAAVVRVEQLYPFPEDLLSEVLERYPDATELWWVQEEPENMGAWAFMQSRLERLLRDGMKLSHVARPESASPATGSPKLHEQEQQATLEEAFSELS
ncbi:MAG: multifunctional oxoglutarate decarboxylase/oxoglutarate dehydrogenase thiamine pyrophosphate-binding subunit/dihydrolipoyllysine-residue succinyltransferase subunit [Actinomycetota bacterium]|nr:multifunctional oxoglutarate decarboxylase/oxoglutarate dehydrogenase thiamine pyrophosphate-binding subunit/dihydrolipoyllysine-residue succinyltransferase subunit [Actinomycetota bacterium]